MNQIMVNNIMNVSSVFDISVKFIMDDWSDFDELERIRKIQDERSHKLATITKLMKNEN
jgi:hypothetical protein